MAEPGGGENIMVKTLLATSPATGEWGRLLHSPEIVFLIGVMINGRMQRQIVFRGTRHRHGRMNVALPRNHRSRPHVPLWDAPRSAAPCLTPLNLDQLQHMMLFHM